MPDVLARELLDTHHEISTRARTRLEADGLGAAAHVS